MIPKDTPPKRPTAAPAISTVLRRVRRWTLGLLYAFEFRAHEEQRQIQSFLELEDVCTRALALWPEQHEWIPLVRNQPDRSTSDRLKKTFDDQEWYFEVLRRLESPERQQNFNRAALVVQSLSLLASINEGESAPFLSEEESFEILTDIAPFLVVQRQHRTRKLLGELVASFPLTREFAIDISAKMKTIDAVIQRSSKRWRVGRMSSIDRNILRLASYELMFRDDVPNRVMLHDVIDMAKSFGTTQSGGFVNGILQQICTDNDISLS